MRKRVLLVLSICAGVLWGLLQPTYAAPSRRSTGPLASTLGFRPNGGLLDPASLRRYEAWLGRDIAWTMQIAGRRSVADMTGSVYGLLSKPGAPLAGQAKNLGLILTVPLAFGNATTKTEAGKAEIRRNLARTAAGEWDEHFDNVAQRLVSAGYGGAIIRLGHEFTGRFYPWSAQADPNGYIKAFRHVHDIFTARSKNFQFEWNAARNTWIEFGPAAYPGDNYVDIVGMDVYYEPQKGNGEWSDTMWNNQYLRVLDSNRDFAVAHGKRLAYAEWATTVDEPRFIERMHEWFSSLPTQGVGSLVHHTYFSPNRDYTITNHRKVASAYRSLFGGGSAASTSRSGVGADSEPQAVIEDAELAPTTVEVVEPVAPDTTTAAGDGEDLPSTSPDTPDPMAPEVGPFGDLVPLGNVTVEARDVVEGAVGSTSLPFRIRLAEPAPADVAFTVSTEPGTETPNAAEAGVDYTVRSDVLVVIPAGSRAVWVGVPVHGDDVSEDDEAVTITVRSGSGALEGSVRASGLILDDD